MMCPSVCVELYSLEVDQTLYGKALLMLLADFPALACISTVFQLVKGLVEKIIRLLGLFCLLRDSEVKETRLSSCFLASH